VFFHFPAPYPVYGGLQPVIQLAGFGMIYLAVCVPMALKQIKKGRKQ
jgi:hypothetical protein